MTNLEYNNTHPLPNANARSGKHCEILLNEYAPLSSVYTQDDSDVHQRDLRERYQERADHETLHTHDMLELSRNSRRHHWSGVEAVRSDCHLIR